ncbi:hypothetical protein TRIUR3_12936 [Triticum urartu]|uniref:Uncharacterized protein n=1 Tax=Triticum urartu TaxID=4572 RepID=M7YXD0_TRIUA|nr:hypothetical protein TRIUR3_12936 [Triticum urartu]
MAVAEARLRQDKVKKFEDFVDRRLKPDLVNAIAQRDNLFQQQKTFLDLKKNIENLEKNGVTSMRSMVNLGSEAGHEAHFCGYRSRFSCGIYLARGSAVYICTRSKVGQVKCLDSPFLVNQGEQKEMVFSSLVMALRFLDDISIYLFMIDEYTHLIASIKAQIKMVCEGIRELLQLAAE